MTTILGGKRNPTAVLQTDWKTPSGNLDMQ